MGTELIRRFRNGDREAFTALYHLYHPPVFRFALHMTGDRPKAEETVQDVFVWLIHNPGKFDSERGELGAFLLGVTRRFLQKRYESEKRFVAFDRSFDRAQPESSSERDTAELKSAILALPPRYREVIVLCDLEERSYEETAALLDCALGTVRSRLHRARALLERKLRVREGCVV